MTENDAAIAYINAWKKYDAQEFLRLVSNDVVYNSQWVLEEMRGKARFFDYFTGKIEAVKKANVAVRAVIGKTTCSWPDRNCVLLFQSNPDSPDAVVIFEVSDKAINKIDMCIPGLLAPVILE